MPFQVYRVIHLALALAGVRLGLGAAGFLAALAAGAELDAATVGLAVGMGASLVGLVSSQRWSLVEQPEVEELPADATRGGALRPALVQGLLPSTVVVAGFLAVSLAFEPILAAVLAGVLAGMGARTVASVVEVWAWERRTGLHLFADGARRRYGAPR